MIYEALGAKLPVFAHVSLLIGQDRQKLSKRHGATSVNLYRNEHYLPEAMCNYLCLLGWSHPSEKDIFDKSELKDVFNLERFSASPAMYDIEKLKWVNGEHVKKMSNADLITLVDKEPETDFFSKQTSEWKLACVELLKRYALFIPDFPTLINDLILKDDPEMTDALKEILVWETTPKIMNFISSELEKVTSEFVTEAELNGWMESVKKDLGIKGKPLFQGVRAAITGHDHGPDLKFLVPLTPVNVLKKRLQHLNK
jgi:glutamyl/glutaminyl-tRNA synthetase